MGEIGLNAKNLSFEPATILIVDDIDYNREIIQAFLGNFNFTLLEASNGQEALDQVYKHKPDLVLLDMKMPVMDGYETSRRLNEDPSVCNIPVIAITASALKQDEQIISQLCSGFLSKPISQKALLSEMARHIPCSQQ
ncbi:response regulator [Verrucomicrobiota bacterium]